MHTDISGGCFQMFSNIALAILSPLLFCMILKSVSQIPWKEKIRKEGGKEGEREKEKERGKEKIDLWVCWYFLKLKWIIN